MSEIICITRQKNDDEYKLGSIGTISKNVSISLRDENGSEVDSGDVGAIWVKGPNMMLGYYNQHELTKEVLQNGWLYTGDLAHCDDEGYYWFHGRIKQLIIRQGDNISPLEVEEVIAKHPAIKNVAVIGMRDFVEGEVPVAFVTLKKNKPINENELIQFTEQYLEDYKVPVKVYIKASLPLTKSNKIDRKRLKEELE